ncbi:flp pilus-assembly TadE/G-like family protein [Streptomyces sp. P38-E01]|uniref:Flp pilus-assembly TadE/G-like family protein n=2 Tax=Streptomyces tardus TaxID=2780544 RepID=A0A949N3V3_9ACTN|nr:flp pilus-assembly TadE/G-like family protein [Streptomyces tardus]
MQGPHRFCSSAGYRLRRSARCGDDGGSATVWAAWSALALCTVFLALMSLCEVVAVRHRTAGAADLAALAAAARAPQGQRPACGAARRVAEAQGASVVRCVLGPGGAVDLTARISRGPYAPEIRSRAGPPGAVR